MIESPSRMSPRQRMINLMYLVLTAMLALNVSSDVLNGFTQVHDGLEHSNNTAHDRNAMLFESIESFARVNPEKGEPWLRKAELARRATKDLQGAIDSLSLAIVREADGPEGDVSQIRNREDLEAASIIMLNPATRRGEDLRHKLEVYVQILCSLLPDSAKRESISSALATEPSGLQQWEEVQFDQMPVIAAITLLSKLQSDLLFAEGEALSSLYAQIDADDVRVNQLDAFVIPQSRIVMSGDDYRARVALAAVDTTQRPEIYLNGKALEAQDGAFSVHAAAPGNYDYSGYVKVAHSDGSFTTHDFSSSYTVIEPAATVSATMMNVLYAGIANPLSISVPAVPTSQLSATISNGSLTRNGDRWIATPNADSADAVINVIANINGKVVNVASHKFRVRRLPDPVAYISYADADGHVVKYHGSMPIAKAALLGADALEAAIDDGLLDTKFEVQGFQTVLFDAMGNAMPENSAGAAFSARQRQQIQRLARGKRFYISAIKAKGPDGTVRNLSPIEVIIK